MLRSLGKSDWENYVHIICANINNCSQDALGGMTPASVNDLTEYQVRNAQQKKNPSFLDWRRQEENVKLFNATKPSKRKINLGDLVYKHYGQKPLGKSYDIQAGRLYLVRRILASKDQLRYELCGLKGNPIEGSYYGQQLVVSPEKPDQRKYWLIKPNEHRPERMYKGKKQVYVEYQYYPANEGEWVLKSDLVSASKANELT